MRGTLKTLQPGSGATGGNWGCGAGRGCAPTLFGSEWGLWGLCVEERRGLPGPLGPSHVPGDPATPPLPRAVPLRPHPPALRWGPTRMNKVSRDLACDLERSLPAVASLSSSLSHKQSLSSHFLLPPPEKRQAISDVRRTFCLFVTFDLLFISLLWIIELNVSGLKGSRGPGGPEGDPWASVTPSAMQEGNVKPGWSSSEGLSHWSRVSQQAWGQASNPLPAPEFALNFCKRRRDPNQLWWKY